MRHDRSRRHLSRRLYLPLYGSPLQMLRLNDEIWADMTAQSLQGSLRVGLPYDLVTPLASAIKAFAEAHPRA